MWKATLAFWSVLVINLIILYKFLSYLLELCQCFWPQLKNYLKWEHKPNKILILYFTHKEIARHSHQNIKALHGVHILRPITHPLLWFPFWRHITLCPTASIRVSFRATRSYLSVVFFLYAAAVFPVWKAFIWETEKKSNMHPKVCNI